MSPRSRPDAEIVTIIDKPIELKERPFHSFTKYKGKDVDVSPVIDHLSRLGRQRSLLTLNAPSGIIHNNEVLINNKYRILQDEFDPTLIAIMLEGRNRLHALLDTPGGSSITSSRYTSATTEIKNRGGIVETWAGPTVMSAGAKIFEEGTRRYGLRKSSFLWHLPYMPGEDEDFEVDEERSCEEMENIKSFFQTHCNPKDFPSVLYRIAEAESDSENPLNDTTFTGEELKSYGILNRVFPNSASMWRTFSKRVGPDKIPSPAKEFFSNLREKEFFASIFGF